MSAAIAGCFHPPNYCSKAVLLQQNNNWSNYNNYSLVFCWYFARQIIVLCEFVGSTFLTRINFLENIALLFQSPLWREHKRGRGALSSKGNRGALTGLKREGRKGGHLARPGGGNVGHVLITSWVWAPGWPWCWCTSVSPKTCPDSRHNVQASCCKAMCRY